MKNLRVRSAARKAGGAGFTLIEFLVAMGVFLVVMGAVFSLFRKDDPLFNQQQNQASLNLALQNVVTQIQVDAVNAGTGYYPGTNIPNWPVGITIQNSGTPSATACGNNPTYSYLATCFDTLNVITVDPNTAPQHLGTAGGSVNTTAGSMVLYTPGLTAAQLTALAASYQRGDTLLLVASDGSQMTTVNLTANGSVSGGAVRLSFTATNSSGQNPSDSLQITSNTGALSNPHVQLGTVFGNNDWVLRLMPITYKVDDTDPTNPKLTRQLGGNAADVIAEQMIGFKVGAALWNDTNDTDYTNYRYKASDYPSGNYDFTILRSIRVSVVGRTPPNAGSIENFHNSYDQGPYHIQGLSVVVNPRNLSMAD